MLLEAQGRKIRDFQAMRSEELDEVDKLRTDLRKEKADQLKKKQLEREACLKVIKENEVEKQRRVKGQE